MPPRETALEVASGAIDLGLEGESCSPGRTGSFPRSSGRLPCLRRPPRESDANRTATREMREVLGSPPEPHLGATREIVRSRIGSRTEIGSLVAHGAGVVEVRVPASWD